MSDDIEDEIKERKTEEVDDLKERGFAEDDSDGQLAIDVYQTPTDIIIKTMVAGIRPEDLDISITRDMVTIKSSREDSATVENEDYFHRELFGGRFPELFYFPKRLRWKKLKP